ncbi:LysR family transcriptional regulator [Marinobacter sp. M1N3S26]|uniref:LysR family transcriptional regulator n=1 Tax=Marinobacter sp. M1N3S26 TaxID=3382299 RepID=UPI00387AFFAE
MLELRLLRYFVVVAQEESIGRAAEKLCISASPLSRQIQQLEERLGISLFTRESGRIRLTHDGERFAHSAKSLLHHAQEVEQQAHQIRDGFAGKINIGYVEGALNTRILQSALRQFGDEFPGVDVETRLLRSYAQVEAVRKGSLDIGFVYSSPNDVDELEAHLLMEEPLIIAVPGSWSLANEPSISADRLQHCPVVGLPKSFHPEANKDLIRECKTAGWELDIRYEASEPSTAVELVEAGLGVALVQKSMCYSHPQNVVMRELPWLQCSVRIYLIHRKAIEKTSVARFVDMALD